MEVYTVYNKKKCGWDPQLLFGGTEGGGRKVVLAPGERGKK